MSSHLIQYPHRFPFLSGIRLFSELSKGITSYDPSYFKSSTSKLHTDKEVKTAFIYRFGVLSKAVMIGP